MRNSILLLVLLVALISAEKNEPKRTRYCGRAVNKVMSLLCPSVQQQNIPSKRSFQSLTSKRDEYEIWKRVFNINDNTTVTIPEIAFQMNLLFGHCNDFQKQVELKNLLEMFKNHEYKRLLNREYTNERLLNGNFLNYEPSDEESLKSLAFNPLTRFRRAPRGIYEECCLEPCSITDMKAFCPTD